MATGIPGHRRSQVKEREHNRCFNCGVPTAHGDWHHRRSRSVRDPHQHCACNGVWLCQTCHDWVHAHPFEARTLGLIVSRHVTNPGTVIATAYFGDILLDCTGNFTVAFDEEEGEA